MENLVDVEEFESQVWNIEGVKVRVTPRNGFVKPYNYERLSDNATVDDLKSRMRECFPPFKYVIKMS